MNETLGLFEVLYLCSLQIFPFLKSTYFVCYGAFNVANGHVFDASLHGIGIGLHCSVHTHKVDYRSMLYLYRARFILWRSENLRQSLAGTFL